MNYFIIILLIPVIVYFIIICLDGAEYLYVLVPYIPSTIIFGALIYCICIVMLLRTFLKWKKNVKFLLFLEGNFK
jgi:hypothetical protein